MAAFRAQSELEVKRARLVKKRRSEERAARRSQADVEDLAALLSGSGNPRAAANGGAWEQFLAVGDVLRHYGALDEWAPTEFGDLVSGMAGGRNPTTPMPSCPAHHATPHPVHDGIRCHPTCPSHPIPPISSDTPPSLPSLMPTLRIPAPPSLSSPHQQPFPSRFCPPSTTHHYPSPSNPPQAHLPPHRRPTRSQPTPLHCPHSGVGSIPPHPTPPHPAAPTHLSPPYHIPAQPRRWDPSPQPSLLHCIFPPASSPSRRCSPPLNKSPMRVGLLPLLPFPMARTHQILLSRRQ